MSPRIRTLTLVPLLCLPLVSSCIVAAAAGAGYLVSREVLPNDVYSAQVRVDVDDTWEATRETLGYMVDPGNEVTTTSSPRVAKAKVDGADVTVTVEAYDLDRTTITVAAERPLRHDGATANEVLNAVLDHLD